MYVDVNDGKLRNISERDFAQSVVEMAQALHWMVFRTWNSKHSPEGEPDLRMVRPPRLIFAELKREGAIPTLKQAEALDLLGQCPGLEVYLWRPSDWGNIARILA